MKLSVIITTKENFDTIEQCILRVILAPPRDKEIIVVYGSGKDKKILEKFRYNIKAIKDNISPPSAINTGVLNSTGEILFYIEGHSFVSSEIFVTTLKEFEKNKKLGYLIFKRFIPPNIKWNNCQELINLMKKNGTMGQFRGFRRKTFFDVGGFWVYPFGADDLEFATRVYEKGWNIGVIETKSFDIPRNNFLSHFKYQLKKVGVSEYLWYEAYRKTDYAKHEYGKNVLYNLFLKRFLSFFHALKVAIKEKKLSFFPFYIFTQICYITGFIFGGIFHRKKQRWLKFES